MKIGAIIQARNSSTRLPQKIIKYLPLNSKITVLEQVIRRLKHCPSLDEIILATTHDKEDEILLEIASKEEIKAFQGDLNDVLTRFYQAAKKFDLDIIVRITSDCPCIDPEIVEQVIKLHTKENADYTSNILLRRTFPHGLDVEVFTMEALTKAYKNADLQFDREHVCPYFYRTKPEDFSLASLEAKNDSYFAPEIRITLDTHHDYILLSAIYDYLYSDDRLFTTPDIIQLFNEHPWLKMLNDDIIQKKVSYTYEEEIEEAIKLMQLQGLSRIKKRIEQLKSNGELQC